jgi:hypothetical protein
MHHRELRAAPLFSRAVLLGASALPLLAGAAAGCASSWQAEPGLLAPPRLVAAALGDALRAEEDAIDPTGIPVLEPPTHVRPCCQLGMDQRVKLGDVEVPGFVRPNVLGIEELGNHSYDSGLVPLTMDEHGVDAENNGIAYTCRGGFVDTAHVRDNADWTFFLALRIARSLPEGTTIDVPGDGAKRRVVVRAVPAELLARRGRFAAAAELAQRAAYEIGLWHEIASWYGVESVKGFSEKGSAFSPEDLYSNVLGIKIGSALASGTLPRTLEEYNVSLDAWLSAVLRRLDVLPRAEARAAMKSVDGLWWDSRKLLPDPTMVLRRNLEIGSRQAPWRLEDGLPPGEIPRSVRDACQGAAPPLALSVPEALDGLTLSEVVTLEIEPDGWAGPARFPFPRPGGRLTSVDFPAVVAAMRGQMQEVLGKRLDRPARTP